jgi:hypothetical protein
VGKFSGAAKKILKNGAGAGGKAAAGIGKGGFAVTKVAFKLGGKTIYYFVPDKVKNIVEKGKPDRCSFCNKPLIAGKGGVVQGDSVHKKCLKSQLDDSVSKYESIMDIDNSIYHDDGRNKNTTIHNSCGCNQHNMFHNCPGLEGQRINVREKPTDRQQHQKGRWGR